MVPTKAALFCEFYHCQSVQLILMCLGIFDCFGRDMTNSSSMFSFCGSQFLTYIDVMCAARKEEGGKKGGGGEGGCGPNKRFVSNINSSNMQSK